MRVGMFVLEEGWPVCWAEEETIGIALIRVTFVTIIVATSRQKIGFFRNLFV
jgi:hypothetical protein